VLAREPRDLEALGRDVRWLRLAHAGPGWSDDASSLWSAFVLGGASRR
jgi:hypothetical protein